MDKRYDAKVVEQKWQKYWEKNKTYKFDAKSKKPVFSIDTPPPYASAGHLHVGHLLHYTQFELIARYKRMKGFNVYFPPCFDNNGLPTEKYVEEKFKVSKNNISKAKFRKLCLEESRKVEKVYADKVFRDFGHSYDWDLLYTTIDPEAQKVSQMSFVDLYEKGHVYRAEEPTLWCTYHQTALAQAEVENKERGTSLNYIYFDSSDSKIEIATTRPELLGACVGIFVHPKDKRYKKLVGKTAKVPLFNYEVPVMEDELVDKEFGSGIVMVCTFGDNTDIEWWKKHKLPLKIVFDDDGKLNEKAGVYTGLNFKEAREKILDDLDKEGRLIKKEKLKQNVGCCWRCSTPVEFIVNEQWFIKTLKFKKELIKQGRKINWHPGFYRVRYEDWTKNLAWDWCISRQRFYGVPFPVWYCKDCSSVIVADKKDLPVDPEVDKPKKKCKCGSNNFVAEADVFDTWMTSSVSPQIACKWLENPAGFKKKFPMSLRPQSHDIIRTWAFYTILKSYLHLNEIPWTDIAIGTYILDPHGKGMHKSKGNAVWVHELADKYDVDAIRYWVGTAKWGEDLPFKENDLVAGQKFMNKLWNSSKFCFMHLEDYDGKKPSKLEEFDKWILSKLDKVIKVCTEKFDGYDTSESKKVVETFFWRDFCDNYLEIVKDRLYNPDRRGDGGRKSAQYVLHLVLVDVLKMMAPIMPHITEEIYSYLFKDSIHLSEWPKVRGVESTGGDLAVDLISKIRQFKSSHGKSLKEEVVVNLDKKNKKVVEKFMDDFVAVTKAKEVKFGERFRVSF